jgi:hypothetical protein
LAVALSATSGCLPRGPISISWPWRHSAADCPDCDSADGTALNAPHSMFHPVPTRPVFTPWLVEDSKPTIPPGTIAAHQPDEKSLDKRETPPSDSELADRRPAVRSAAARSSAPLPLQRSESSSAATAAPTAADEYYNPSNESAGSSQSAPSRTNAVGQ